MSRSADVRLVLFDLDGTLTDSAPGILNGIRFALADMGIACPDDATLRSFLGPPLVETFGRQFGMDGGQVEYAIARYREHYHDVGLFENGVYAGIPELLETLASTDATLAVATSKPTYSATRILERYELASYFSFIGGAELDGSRNGKAAVIAHTLTGLTGMGLPSSAAGAVMVGDREHDVHGARAHGIDCIGVLWGYGDADELLAAGATALAASPGELRPLLP